MQKQEAYPCLQIEIGTQQDKERGMENASEEAEKGGGEEGGTLFLHFVWTFIGSSFFFSSSLSVLQII